VRIAAALQFVLLLAGAIAFLWQSDLLPLAESIVWLAGLTIGLWSVGQALQGRLMLLDLLLIDAAALATASAALGLGSLHLVCKPLALLLAMALAAERARGPGRSGRFAAWLLAALAASLAGDVLLMLAPRYFVPGLVSFLLAHLAYIRLFSLGVGFMPRRRPLAITLAVGIAMYAFLWWGGLPAALRLPVGIYMLVIACMAAQALGRAAELRNAPAFGVAVGACLFMLSDALLATNRFVLPLPLASLWVLASYYAAQILIVRQVQPVAAERTAPSIRLQAT
jgi:uncharacterized membrane protein YhhN